MKSKLTVLLILIYVSVLLVSLALTREPWGDEGVFAGNAHTLLHYGHLGTFTAAPNVLWIRFPAVTEYTYWIMPIYLVSLAGWFRVFGESLTAARSLAMLCGLGSLVLWFLLVRQITGNRRIAVLSLLLLGVDLSFLMRSSETRMDALCLLFSMAGYVAYFRLRERGPLRAFAVANVFAAAALLTHPNGAPATLGLWMIALYLEWRRGWGTRIAICLLGGVPHIVGWATYYFLYVSHAPSIWRAQLLGHANGRLQGVMHPLQSMWEEFSIRYGTSFGFAGHVPVWRRFGIVLLTIYVIATVFCFVKRDIRKMPGVMLLQFPFLAFLGYFTFFEGPKSYIYTIQIMPYYVFFLAVMLEYLITQRRTAAAYGIAALMVGAQFGGVFLRVWPRPYEGEYAAAVQAIRMHLTDAPAVIAPSGMAFDLGFERVREDWQLETLLDTRVDVVAQSVVREFDWRERPFRLPGMPADVAGEIPKQMADFERVFGNSLYVVYARRR